jgi:hypothetical protein
VSVGATCQKGNLVELDQSFSPDVPVRARKAHGILYPAIFVVCLSVYNVLDACSEKDIRHDHQRVHKFVGKQHMHRQLCTCSHVCRTPPAASKAVDQMLAMGRLGVIFATEMESRRKRDTDGAIY